MLQLIFINLSGRISPELLDVTNKHALACTRVCTVCIHLEQAVQTLFKEVKRDTDVLKETFAL